MMEKILCVDDDANIVDGFKRQLRKQFVIETALSGEAGLEVLDARGPFAVIVSDMRMPGMNGAQFLAQVRERAPDSVRIMLTGQTDMQAAIAAVNEGHIFRFLTKPCPPEHLVLTLQAALTQYRLVTAERTLLEHTLRGCIKVLTDILALVNPVAFGRASRLKRYARHIATHLDLPDVWQFEVAAMLSQLGCVALSADTLEKLYMGQALSSDEQKMFAKHPSMGADLLRHIPRLEAIAAMIGRQQAPAADSEALQDPQRQDTVLLGAHILKIIGEFDQLVNSGVSHHDAIRALRKRPDPYGIVAALQGMDIDAGETAVRMVTVRDLRPGMILDEDVRSKTGILVLAKGHEVTKVMMERLRSYAQKVEVVEPFRALMARSGSSQEGRSSK
jgi:response regulator RpfG family c-di-GMP phosphodiesterase